MDIARITTQALTPFEVPVTIDGVDGLAVVDLDVEVWGPDGVTMSRMDMITVRSEAPVTPGRGSVVSCSDLSVMPAAMTWVVTDRSPQGGDGHVTTWHMKRTG